MRFHWMSSLAILSIGEAKGVLVLTNSIFGAIEQIREICCPQGNIEGVSLHISHSHVNKFWLFVCDRVGELKIYEFF